MLFKLLDEKGKLIGYKYQYGLTKAVFSDDCRNWSWRRREYYDAVHLDKFPFGGIKPMARKVDALVQGTVYCNIIFDSDNPMHSVEDQVYDVLAKITDEFDEMGELEIVNWELKD